MLVAEPIAINAPIGIRFTKEAALKSSRRRAGGRRLYSEIKRSRVNSEDFKEGIQSLSNGERPFSRPIGVSGFVHS